MPVREQGLAAHARIAILRAETLHRLTPAGGMAVGGKPNVVTRLGWWNEQIRLMPVLVTVSTTIPYAW
ncbi:hypothetical protein SCOCK_30309 [Actinacidiphila cocklensis]|uniref:Uncharacterized protein n=1 Tax=Actinacidiphila cocklensis TaxID=887465 RepID=A0A9W4GSS9_9ACTN|nr:hypothetical protein SCOCK_30309 [Actinacidiphila cocklensis]